MRQILVDTRSSHSFCFTGAKLITLYTYDVVCLPFVLLADVEVVSSVRQHGPCFVNMHAGACSCAHLTDGAVMVELSTYGVREVSRGCWGAGLGKETGWVDGTGALASPGSGPPPVSAGADVLSCVLTWGSVSVFTWKLDSAFLKKFKNKWRGQGIAHKVFQVPSACATREEMRGSPSAQALHVYSLLVCRCRLPFSGWTLPFCSLSVQLKKLLLMDWQITFWITWHRSAVQKPLSCLSFPSNQAWRSLEDDPVRNNYPHFTGENSEAQEGEETWGHVTSGRQIWDLDTGLRLPAWWPLHRCVWPENMA